MSLRPRSASPTRYRASIRSPTLDGLRENGSKARFTPPIPVKSLSRSICLATLSVVTSSRRSSKRGIEPLIMSNVGLISKALFTSNLICSGLRTLPPCCIMPSAFLNNPAWDAKASSRSVATLWCSSIIFSFVPGYLNLSAVSFRFSIMLSTSRALAGRLALINPSLRFCSLPSGSVAAYSHARSMAISPV